MKRSSFRLLVLAAVGLPISSFCFSSAIAAEEASANSAVLKPFQSSGAPAVSGSGAGKTVVKHLPANVSIAGSWTGEFKHAEGPASAAVLYNVDVNPQLTSIRVSKVPMDAVSGEQQFLQPVTSDAVSANWDGTTLSARIREDHRDGDTLVEVSKRLTLQFERDSKHALFTYVVDVKSTTGPRTKTFTLNGSGVLTRPKVANKEIKH